MPIYKILFPAIAISFLLRGFYLMFKGKKGWREMLFWTVFWGYFILLAIYPNTIEIFAKITGIQDSVRAFFASVIMILVFVILKMFLIIEKLDRDLTKIVRKMAIKSTKYPSFDLNSKNDI